ncbi:MAG: alpha-L-fucosidase, partial [Urechidicola sp.]|nr:alpha-L-fucosidase [Urechidicola sp.]
MKTIIKILIFVVVAIPTHSQNNSSLTWEQMNASKEVAKEAFNDAKFGMFIHWGLYSIPGGIWKDKKIEEYGRPSVAEWIQCTAKIPRDEYAQLANQFNPTEFDADAIARLAKDAGMKYLVITSKHHDGFAMYDSKVSDYDIIDTTPFKRDVVKELYDACQKYDLDFGLYYSHNIDWKDGFDCGYQDLMASGREVNVKAKRKMGANMWDPSPNTFGEYLDKKAYPQVKEILANFPDLKTLWYDMPHYLSPDQSAKFYKIAFDLQPQMLINERVGNDMGDFDIPGDNKIPQDHLAITKPWQTVGTTNNSWGYKSYDNDWKSVKELLFWLTEIVSKGGNYMLNIGPTETGIVPQESVNNLRAVGNWLAINGEAIYNTRKWEVSHEGPTNIEMNGTSSREKHKGLSLEFTSDDFWFTKKENFVYAISLENGQQVILIKSLEKGKYKVEKVELLGHEEIKTWEQNANGLTIALPENMPSEIG